MTDRFEEVKFKQFDKVQLRTSINVKYRSSPPGAKVSPKGVWTVIAAMGDELLLSKHDTIIRIPSVDVLKIADHNMVDINATLGRLLDHGT